MNLQQIEPEKIEQLIAALEAEANEDKLASYKPYLKQAEFHAAGAKHRERLLMAGNQLGKTLAGAMETAIHAAGRYPSWWQGKRFDKPTISWVAGTTGETVRDTVQRLLIGRSGQEGTGAIPKDAIAELVPARGIHCLIPFEYATNLGPSRPLASKAISGAASHSRVKRWTSFGSMKSRRPMCISRR